MTSIKKLVGALALIGAATGVHAANITNGDGTFSFTGFDWDSFGSALISGYDLTAASGNGNSDDFTLTYQSFATSIKDGSGNNIANSSLTGLRAGSGSGYEYTIVVTVNERATLIGSDGTNGAASLSVLGGVFDIYYQLAGNASNASGTGFSDGTKILGGTILSSFVPGGSSTVLSSQGLTNPGDASLAPSLKGEVTFQDLSYISPLLQQTKATTTLQFGNFIDTAWVRPSSINGIPVALLNTNTDFVAQADGNQSFTRIPEPASAALFGLALAGLGLSSRRNKLK